MQADLIDTWIASGLELETETAIHRHDQFGRSADHASAIKWFDDDPVARARRRKLHRHVDNLVWLQADSVKGSPVTVCSYRLIVAEIDGGSRVHCRRKRDSLCR